MNDFNFDTNAINKLKDMMNKGDLNDVISQIPPEMIENLSNMMHANSSPSINSSNQQSNQQSNQNSNQDSTQNTNHNSSNNAFDFSNIDMNTILKMKSIMEKISDKNDPRSNLLHSLKPYLRKGRKEKLDQYANLLNVAKIAELLKKDNKENIDNG